MLDQTTRAAILRLREAGHGTRAIARALAISRGAVQDVLARGAAAVPCAERAENGAPHRDRILARSAACKGNLVRVHEELCAEGATLSYPALTAFCRRHGLGHSPMRPAGQSTLRRGRRCSTTPRRTTCSWAGGSAGCASLVLCHSRLLFFQHSPRCTRFACTVFLTEALRSVGGACTTCMIDNTHVVVLAGTGAAMVPVPEMAAFAERFAFTFRAHEQGDAKRSARVERPFACIEGNFLAGRAFADWAALNQEARRWCDKVNAAPKRHLHASPRELFAAEAPQLRPSRPGSPRSMRSISGSSTWRASSPSTPNRYSAPSRLIGRRLEVRETRARALPPRRPMRGEPDPGAERVEDFRVRRDLAWAQERARSGPDGIEERRARVVVDQPREPAHVADAAGRRVLLEPPQVVGQLGDSAQERGLLGRTAPDRDGVRPLRPRARGADAAPRPRPRFLPRAPRRRDRRMQHADRGDGAPVCGGGRATDDDPRGPAADRGSPDRGDRHGHEPLPHAGTPRELGGDVSQEQRERRQAQEREDPQGEYVLRQALVEAGQAAARTKDTALSGRHRRIMRHHGYREAVVAVGHEIRSSPTASSRARPRTTDSGPPTSTGATPNGPHGAASASSSSSAIASRSSPPPPRRDFTR
jgi:hypothetical protein